SRSPAGPWRWRGRAAWPDRWGRGSRAAASAAGRTPPWAPSPAPRAEAPPRGRPVRMRTGRRGGGRAGAPEAPQKKKGVARRGGTSEKKRRAQPEGLHGRERRAVGAAEHVAGDEHAVLRAQLHAELSVGAERLAERDADVEFGAVALARGLAEGVARRRGQEG